MKFYGLLGLMALAITSPASAAVMNYVITGYATGSNPIVSVRSGSTTDVTGSGGATNTILTAPGAFVDFTIGNADAIVGDKFLAANINALPTVATLRVTLNAVSGSGTELMLARTSNSQGLTDIGTMTILLTGLNGNNTQVNGATFQFDWRNAANTGALGGSDQMVFTSYDLDFGQRNSIPTADIGAYALADPTGLVVSTSGSDTIFRDGPPEGDTGFDNPLGAYAFSTVAGDNTQTITVDKTGASSATGNQLYMFSFRSPSPLIPVIPEPSAALLGGLGLLALLRRRR